MYRRHSFNGVAQHLYYRFPFGRVTKGAQIEHL
jgi:hypothetical protein